MTFKGKCAMIYKTVTDGVRLGKISLDYFLFSIFNRTFNDIKNSQHYSYSGIEIWKCSLDTEEKRETTFRSSTDEIFETLTWNNKTR